MGTIVVSTIITSLRRILLDPTPGVTWDDTTLVKLLSEAERAICLVKHEAVPVREAIPLVAGVQQAIPATGVALLDLFENLVGTKRRMRLVDRQLQDAGAIFYAAATQEAEAQEWTKDDRDPTRFTVLPPNDGTGSVMGLYGSIPAQLADAAAVIHVPDIYEKVLKDFVLSQCYAENTGRQDLAKAAAYEQAWRGALGLSSQSQVAVSPKVIAQGGTR